MLVNVFPRIVTVVGPLLILIYIFFIFLHERSTVEQSLSWAGGFDSHDTINTPSELNDPGVLQDPLPLPSNNNEHDTAPTSPLATHPSSPSNQGQLFLPAVATDSEGNAIVNSSIWREVFSVSTADKKYFSISFGSNFPSLNPNIIPHPHDESRWIVVAQHEKSKIQDGVFEEFVCDASFQEDGSLTCLEPPAILPVQPTNGNNCKGRLEHFSLNVGPHDMRVFYGPNGPFSIFGSQSAHTCFGLFVQDFRPLVNDFGLEALTSNLFTGATELQRPPPWSQVEKNWFLFWDILGQVYVHHDIEPERVFAQLLPDGALGPNLAPISADSDKACMAKYMPKPAPVNENLHQATNSLSITLCKRNDPSCQPSDENTFIMTIFQHKFFYDLHSIYEPYVMLFQQGAPFAVHAVSRKPIWIHGRGVLSHDTNAARWKAKDAYIPKGHTEMFYVTSMNWKAHGQRYHGYVDDVLLLGFGIEDSQTAAIDILAGDLLQDVGIC
ncbi:hypothetical protein BCR34DRAFT_472682 [Clohesyomyces aquaticus]|uniref:Uncharacterized protein n=1 Tax=Clohesyomyces aquaticus TaxID=1231657 RepID=A0A1Y2A924_9PLEO|nr:hypothetical protein BCR34DRAFT_472682 [Clohesyomyces aquaticus]